MNGPTGTRNSAHSTLASPSRLSVASQLAINLTTTDLKLLALACIEEIRRRRQLELLRPSADL